MSAHLGMPGQINRLSRRLNRSACIKIITISSHSTTHTPNIACDLYKLPSHVQFRPCQVASIVFQPMTRSYQNHKLHIDSDTNRVDSRNQEEQESGHHVVARNSDSFTNRRSQPNPSSIPPTDLLSPHHPLRHSRQPTLASPPPSPPSPPMLLITFSTAQLVVPTSLPSIPILHTLQRH